MCVSDVRGVALVACKLWWASVDAGLVLVL